MAVSKKQKRKIKSGGTPNVGVRSNGYPEPGVRQVCDPDSFMSNHPSWRLASCDVSPECSWSFHKERLAEVYWDTIFPKLQNFESMTWADILIDGKKQNHSIIPDKLNKVAKDRLADLQVEAEAIFSLRLGGKLRLYGYMIESVYNILWYDDDHGDNSTCVCRSSLKHT